MVIPGIMYLITENRASDLLGRCLAKTVTSFEKFQLLGFPSMIQRRTKVTLKLKIHQNVLRTTGLLNIMWNNRKY